MVYWRKPMREEKQHAKNFSAAGVDKHRRTAAE
jgi:hypothetical protein